MSRRFTCPFCGQPGRSTREHVWAKWLHEYEGAQVLLAGTHGERTPTRGQVVAKGVDGRNRFEPTPSRHVATLLPNVTVDVCWECNTGWMSALEMRVKQMLSPFLDEGIAVTLDSEDLTALAAWATKSWMAYALLRPAQHNPFTTAEYRAIASDQLPIPRSLVWLLHSTGPRAHVGLALESILITQGAPESIEAPANSGFGLLAAHTVVLFMALPPPEPPPGLVDVAFAPPTTGLPGVRRVWPTLRPQYFPLEPVTDDALEALIAYPREFADVVGLPVEGLTDDEIGHVTHEWLTTDADAQSLRERWKR